MRPIGPWTLSGSENQNYSYSYYTGTGLTPATLSSRSKGNVPYTWTRTGYNSGPTWRALARRGSLSPAPMSCIKNQRVDSFPVGFGAIFERTAANKPWSPYARSIFDGQQSIAVPNFDTVFGDRTSGIQNQALSNFYKKVGGVQFDSLTFVGEMKETQTMLRSQTRALATSVLDYEAGVRNSILSKRLKSLTSIASFAADSWLEYQYGIRPLISDVKNAISAYASADSLLTTKKLKGKSMGQWSKTITQDVSLPFLGTPMLGGVSSKFPVTYTRLVMCRVGAIASTSPIYNTNPNWGLSWANVLPAAWELIPYSFLIDYFTNVGDIIQAYTVPKAGLSKFWMTTSIEDAITYGSTRWDITPNSLTRYYGYLGSGEARSFTCIRSVPKSPVLPSLSFSSWDDLSLTKQVNVGALLGQFVARKSSSFNFIARLLA